MHTCLSWPFANQVHCMACQAAGGAACCCMQMILICCLAGTSGLSASMPAYCCSGGSWLLPVMQSAACQTV